MPTRIVTGTILHDDGSPWTGGIIKFELIRAFETSTEVYPVDIHSEILDVNGEFSVTLGVPETGTACYCIHMPDGNRYIIYLASGAATDLITLITIARSRVAQDAVLTLLNTHVSNYHLPSYFTGLTALTAPTFDDILPIIDAPGGTPSIKKVTIQNLLKGVVITVAASNASADQKKQADYICDGTNDNVEIQAAIDFLSPNGGRVRLTGRLFTIADAGAGFCIQIDQSNVHLDIPSGTTIKLKNNEISGTETCNLIRIGDGTNVYSNILIDGGGIIDGNVANNPSTGSISQGAAIYIFGPNNRVAINNIAINNATRDAIYIAGMDDTHRTTNVQINSCLINNCAEGILWTCADYVWVMNCTIINTTEQDGVEPASSTSYFWILNNYFEGIHADNSAIDIFALVGTMCEHGVIGGNIIKGSGGGAGCYDLVIGMSNTGIISDITVTDNHLDEGNVLISNGVGAVVTNLLFNDNIINGSTSYGLYIGAGADYAFVECNTIRNSQSSGIVVFANNVRILGNKIFNNGQDSGLGWQNRCGITIVGSAAHTKITNNDIYDNQGGPTQIYPIFMDTPDSPFIVDNYFAGHAWGDGPFGLATATTPTVRGNHGYVTENHGAAATISDGGTINHGLADTPTHVIATGSVAGEIITVSTFDANHFHVAIKKPDGSAGTQQTIYWEAYL